MLVVTGNSNLDGTITVNLDGTFIPEANDPDLPFFVAPSISGQFATVNSDDYVVVETDNGLALRVPTVALAGAQVASLDDDSDQGQVVAKGLQLVVASSEASNTELDEVFSFDTEFDVFS